MRSVALEGIARTRAGLGHADRTISALLRASRFLHSRERRLVARQIYTGVRHRRTWLTLLGIDPSSEQADLAVLLAGLVRLAGLPAKRALAELPGAGFERIERLEVSYASWSAAHSDNEAARLGVAASLPDWFAARLLGAFGPERACQLAAACNRQAGSVIRTNRLKTERETLRKALADAGHATRPCSLATDGLILERRANLLGSALFKQGHFELQDQGSQLLCELVAPPPRGKVIDFCAGAGGKTLGLAALLANRGRILALDVRPGALKELRKRCRRAGAGNVQAVEIEAEGALPKKVVDFGTADRVLVDAPCSGSGVLRRNPESRWLWKPADIADFAQRQGAILARAAPLVAARGRLIYATCSLFDEENSAVVEQFLASHPEFERVRAREILGGERARALGDGEVLRLLPDSHDCDGFFGAVLRRRRS